MGLRRQLTLVSVLLLCLPWAGCQFVREVEGTLRTAQAQALQSTAGAVAAALGQQSALLYPFPQRRDAAYDDRFMLYAGRADGPVIVDGYGDGWQDVPASSLTSASGSSPAVSVSAQTRDDNLYLLFRITDLSVRYDNPGLPAATAGDRLVLRLAPAGQAVTLAVSTAAPGAVRASATGRLPRGFDPSRVRGFWQDAEGGYSLELEMPLAYTGGRLGFFVLDTETGNTAGNTGPADDRPPPSLLFNPGDLQSALAPFAGIEGQLTVVDREGWILASLPGASGNVATGDTFWLLKLLYRAILRSEEAPVLPAATRPGQVTGDAVSAALSGETRAVRYRSPGDTGRSLLAVAAPIRDHAGVAGAVILYQGSDTYLSLTDQAFSRLLGYSALGLLVAVTCLLGYASVLSSRVRRLARAAQQAIGEDGRVSGDFPRSSAGDEIGDLSRQYADVLERLREYNDYLRSLSRKLSHELRTPIAVIQSSLDNLEQTGGTGEVYRARAREGLGRLQHILTAMSEASRLEESIRGHAPGRLDLVELLADVVESFRPVYPDHRLSLHTTLTDAPVNGVADLVLQALDKLMDNAASFCPVGGEITVQLASSEGGYALSVANDGPTLPPGAAEQLFEPMVSHRETGSEAVHLGLGLHIVRLVVDYHEGTVTAANRAGGGGVAVTMVFPAAG